MVSSNDLIWGLSTSGRSKNVLNALISGRKIGCRRIGFTGQNGIAMEALCNLCFKVSHVNSDRIQEAHMLGYHMLIEKVESKFYLREK